MSPKNEQKFLPTLSNLQNIRGKTKEKKREIRVNMNIGIFLPLTLPPNAKKTLVFSFK
jgi:hypothetical protein